MTTFLLKLVRGPRCEGCGAVDNRFVSRDTHLCIENGCWGIAQKVAERKAKLEATLSLRFAMPIEKIREFRELFGR
ncbi:MAG: hypothetical protein ABSF14_19760 [Terriglobia bacterium]|jgi:hypothetical protein